MTQTTNNTAVTITESDSMPHTNKEENYIGYCPHGAPDGECPVINCANHKEEGEKKECDNCTGYPDGDYGKCGDCGRKIAKNPVEKKGEATGESWEKEFDELCDNTTLLAGNNVISGGRKLVLKDFIRKTLSTTEQANRNTIGDAEYWLWHVVANWGRRNIDPDVKEDLLKAHKILKVALSPQEHTKE